MDSTVSTICNKINYLNGKVNLLHYFDDETLATVCMRIPVNNVKCFIVHERSLNIPKVILTISECCSRGTKNR